VPRYLFITGKLAEPSVQRVLAEAAPRLGIEYDVRVLPITVAALMHSEWVRRKVTVEKAYDRVYLPGWCQGDLSPLTAEFGVPFERGPKDIRDLPAFLGGEQRSRPDLSTCDIEILAEINHAPRLTDTEILTAAQRYRENGADVIDLGCIPGETWSRAGEVAELLQMEGFRISIDSFDRAEVEAAVNAGADLVLSVNSTNLDWAPQLGKELDRTTSILSKRRLIDCTSTDAASGSIRLSNRSGSVSPPRSRAITKFAVAGRISP
jgi:hypothetical protein